MMSSLSEQDWKDLKPDIRKLLAQQTSQKNLINSLAKKGWIVKANQLEYKLKQWGLRHNLNEGAWKFVDHNIKKRKRAGKDSDVLMSGIRIPASKVLRETERHNHVSVVQSLKPASSPKAPEDMNLSICTPPPMTLEFSWPDSLPWFQFEQRFMNSISVSLPLGKKQMLPNVDGLALLLSIPLASTIIKSLPANISRVAAGIGVIMPETYNGENLVRAEVLRNGSDEEKFRGFLKLLLFQLSNNMLDVNNEVIELLRKIPKSLWEKSLTMMESVTAISIVENLFKIAVDLDAEDIIGLALSLGVDKNRIVRCLTKPGIVGSPLSVALDCSSWRVALLLLRSGADVQPRDLHRAVKLGVKEVVEHIIKTGVDVNYGSGPCEPWLSTTRPLTLACLESHPSISRRNIRDIVPVKGDDSEVELLSGDDSDNDNGNDNDNVQGPKADKSAYIAGLLISAGAGPDLDAMIAAAWRGNKRLIHILHQEGVDVRGINSKGMTPLSAAVLGEHPSIVSLLLRLGAEPNIPRGHNQFRIAPSPLHVFVGTSQNTSGAKDDSLHSLLAAGADVNYYIDYKLRPSDCSDYDTKWFWEYAEKRKSLHTPLEFALDTPDNVRFAYPLLDRVDFLGTELHHVARLGDVRLAEQLLQRGLRVNQRNESGLNALDLALREGNVAVAKVLLEAYKAQEGLPSTDRYSSFSAATWNSISHPEQLKLATYDSEALLTVVQKYCENPGKELGTIKKMLSLRDASAVDHENEYAAVCVALAHGLKRPLFDLVDAGVEVNQSVLVSREGLVQEICRIRPEPPRRQHINFSLLFDQNATEKVKCSPVAFALMRFGKHADETVSWLLDHSCLPDSISLLFAALRGRVQALKVLLEKCPDQKATRFEWAPTPLQIAVREGDREMVRVLLDEGVNVNDNPASAPLTGQNYTDDFKLPRTALQYAVEKGNLDLIDILIKKEANINAPSAKDSGATALQLAAFMGYLGIAHYLLDLHADVDAKGAATNGRTALQAAAEHGRIDMIQLLLSSGAGTEGSYRKQYVAAVRLAERNTHFAAAHLLYQYREWTPKDFELYDRLGDADLDRELDEGHGSQEIEDSGNHNE